MSKNKKTVVVGDMNLDHLRWDHPEQHLENMVDETKNVIETSGFLQLVTNFTRSWRNQADSCLDQVWTNCPDRTVKVLNIARGASDHNVVGIHVAAQDIKTGGTNMVKRLWKQFDSAECIRRFRCIDWREVMNETNVNIAASKLEDTICTIMDELAPMKTVQSRTNFNNWLSEDTKNEMKLRDTARKIAKETNLDTDWDNFKKRRNNCTDRQRKDKNVYLREIYSKMETEHDSSRLFATTKHLMGWKQPSPPSCFLKEGITYRKQQDLAKIQIDHYENKIKKD